MRMKTSTVLARMSSIVRFKLTMVLFWPDCSAAVYQPEAFDVTPTIPEQRQFGGSVA